jgi:type IV pilus assembly protein PilP
MKLNYAPPMFRMQLIVAIVTVLSLSACGSGEQEALQQWMTEQRNATKPSVTPIPEPKKFVPKAYTQEAATEPFSNLKLTQALKRDSAQATSNAALVAPELNRRKEPLEAFPLDAMSMVGSLLKTGKPVALVKVDALLYQVQVGNYLGQNYGKVIKVSETELSLREIVQDAAGEWIERQANLQLQERSK